VTGQQILNIVEEVVWPLTLIILAVIIFKPWKKSGK